MPRREKTVAPRFDGVGLSLVAALARLLCRELSLQNECPPLENRIQKENVSGHLRFTDEEPRWLLGCLAEMAGTLEQPLTALHEREHTFRLRLPGWDEG